MWSCTVLCLVVLGSAACERHPRQEPEVSELAGTWTQDTTGTNPWIACLRLNTDHTCVATNFFVTVRVNGMEFISGAGNWELTNYPDFFGWTVVLTGSKFCSRGIPIQNRKAPFLLGRPDVTPAAHRLEEISK